MVSIVALISANTDTVGGGHGNGECQTRTGLATKVSKPDLHYEVAGTGPPMFVVGLLQCELYQRTMPKALTTGLQLVFVELPGTTRSGGDPANLTFGGAAESLDALRAHLGFDKVAVFGHAIHGMFAAAYASRYPATTSHLVLTSTPARVPDDTTEDFWQQDALPERQAAFERQLWSLPEDVALNPFASSESFIQYRTVMAADAWYDPSFDAAWLWDGISASPALLNRLYNELAPGWDAAARLSQVQAPTFVALGRCDYRVPYLTWLRIADDLRMATMKVFDRSSHWPPIEQPDQFAQAVTEFVTT